LQKPFPLRRGKSALPQRQSRRFPSKLAAPAQAPPALFTAGLKKNSAKAALFQPILLIQNTLPGRLRQNCAAPGGGANKRQNG